MAPCILPIKNLLFDLDANLNLMEPTRIVVLEYLLKPFDYLFVGHGVKA